MLAATSGTTTMRAVRAVRQLLKTCPERCISTTSLYDTIAFDYAATKSNPFKLWIEEPTFFGLLGSCTGQTVLDLGCGSGHFCRLIRQRGASAVHGVDVSEAMISGSLAVDLVPVGFFTAQRA